MRDTELDKLHPSFRKRAVELLKRLEEEGLPFQIFEAYRTPKRQKKLFAKGRTTHLDKKPVTKARPWRSYHQYGCAADFVLRIDGRWSWSTKGEHKAWWNRLHELGGELGLEHLSFEKPHLQLAGLSSQRLRRGDYPEGGDESWAANLTSEIEAWPGHNPPPIPEIEEERPPLDDDAFDAEEDLADGLHGDCLKPRNSAPRFIVNARRGLRLRSGPGTKFDSLQTLAAGQEVQVLDTQGRWALVDLQGDGQADGFCHRGFLRSISG